MPLRYGSVLPWTAHLALSGGQAPKGQVRHQWQRPELLPPAITDHFCRATGVTYVTSLHALS